MRAPACSGGRGTQNKRKADDDHDDDAGGEGGELLRGQVRRSDRKRTKVGSYAE